MLPNGLESLLKSGLSMKFWLVERYQLNYDTGWVSREKKASIYGGGEILE